MEKINELNSIEFAKVVIQYLFMKGNNDVTNIRLQKLLYYVQAWHIVYFEKNKLFDELPQAWVKGPVYKNVYTYCKNNGNIFNNEIISNSELQTNPFEKLNISKEQIQLIEDVLLSYNQFSVGKLVYLTHVELPWNLARRDLEEFQPSSNIITVESMFNYYNERLIKSENVQYTN